MNAEEEFECYLEESVRSLRSLMARAGKISEATEALWRTIEASGTIYWCGNGGSAAEAQHMAAELMGRFQQDRLPIRSIALTTDTSLMTAVANDYDFAYVFQRQIEALAGTGDALVVLSTSGTSTNVVAALKAAKGQGVKTIAFTGRGPNPCAMLADIEIEVDATATSHIQEAHQVCLHFICKALEERWVRKWEDRESQS